MAHQWADDRLRFRLYIASGKIPVISILSLMAVPKNRALWNTIKSEARKKFTAWPSAYASYWLSNEYKKRGGTYATKTTSKRRKNSASNRPASKRPVSKRRASSSGLRRWRAEKWVNICSPGRNEPCGRSNASASGKYPLCRPSIRVNAQTPKTLQELNLSTAMIQRLCQRKRANPHKKIRF